MSDHSVVSNTRVAEVRGNGSSVVETSARNKATRRTSLDRMKRVFSSKRKTGGGDARFANGNDDSLPQAHVPFSGGSSCDKREVNNTNGSHVQTTKHDKAARHFSMDRIKNFSFRKNPDQYQFNNLPPKDTKKTRRNTMDFLVSPNLPEQYSTLDADAVGGICGSLVSLTAIKRRDGITPRTEMQETQGDQLMDVKEKNRRNTM
mmetsp:Transcript_38446/g.56630  ORF Transcript_38446/g.56630 Transcript_38446/m.56630 type:complete len:204 (-) Transcript_38446:888-1499(-)|eukprot:CAMPEP_0195514904 /NCGR_PEP_ID=MMETSP0794_2-20130614/6151_1 /TAXON_ID=515487 /ORGANISM="Stephanopyxis turris, Strain CCMP 815" /LENGTH=203 /DNA_ID=CAMNT_0040643249 /DNA_START=43 /DNA_END=654 /DNA_ORIENTATION=-